MQYGNGFVRSRVAEALHGGILLEITSMEEAKRAEDLGAKAIIAVNRAIAISTPDRNTYYAEHYWHNLVRIKSSVALPIIAQCRRGHFVEAQILESLGVAFIDEIEIQEPLIEPPPIHKEKFHAAFINMAYDFSTAILRLQEGASALRVSTLSNHAGFWGTVSALRALRTGIQKVCSLKEEELFRFAIELGTHYSFVRQIADHKRIPTPVLAQGGVNDLADCAMLLQLGADSVIVDHSVWQGTDPIQRIRNLCETAEHPLEPEALLKIALSSREDSSREDLGNNALRFLSGMSPMQASPEYEIT